jgi:hypothetical protein
MNGVALVGSAMLQVAEAGGDGISRQPRGGGDGRDPASNEGGGFGGRPFVDVFTCPSHGGRGEELLPDAFDRCGVVHALTFVN